MYRIKGRLRTGLLLLLFLLPACKSGQLPLVSIRTALGEILVEIDTVRAPVTAGNFLELVDSGVLENALFYRVVRPDNQPHNLTKIEVIQGGLYDDSLIARYPVIRHEPTSETGILHRNGTISMARNEPGTASTEFFICIGDQAGLDFGGRRNPDGQGFAAFGRVRRGMAVVRAIQALPDSLQYLNDPLPCTISRISGKE